MDMEATKRLGYHLQPVFETLDRAMGDPRYSPIHGALKLYKAALLERNLRQALFRADVHAARRYVMDLTHAATRVPLNLRILSWLPDTVLRLGVQLRSRVRTARRELFTNDASR